MLVPAALGGTPVDLQGCLDVIETVAEGNSAAGWNLATSAWCTMGSLVLPRAGAAQLYAEGPDVCFAGGFAGSGEAVPTAGGYHIRGHWRFGSGCLDAQWMFAGCHVLEGGMPRLDTNGQPQRLVAFVRPEQVTIHDTWHVAGLCGTGSHDWSLPETFVPCSLAQPPPTPSPWPDLHARLPMPVFTAVHLSAVATGIARRAIDSLIALAQHKPPTTGPGVLREQVQVQEAVARAEGLLESARAYRAALVASIWARLTAGQPVEVPLRARIRLAGTHTVTSALQAVDLMFHAGGTSAIDEASPLSHCFRDIHVLAQNMNVVPRFYEHVGRTLLGLESGTPLI
jgi:alkylation response protein AidB-like acyl-CoA dehydrogenase